MYYRAMTRERRRRRAAIRALAVAFILLGVILGVNRRIRPVLQRNAVLQAKILFTKVLNQAITEQLQDGDHAYDTMVRLGKAQDGQIVSVELDAPRLNVIQAQLTERAIQQLQGMENNVYTVPLGTLLRPEYCSGKGFRLKFRLEPIGYVTTKILSSFTEAGINQTRHELKFQITVPMAIAMTGYRTDTEIGMDFMLADTLIVGKVPQYYTNVITEDQNLVDELNDYKAEEP